MFQHKRSRIPVSRSCWSSVPVFPRSWTSVVVPTGGSRGTCCPVTPLIFGIECMGSQHHHLLQFTSGVILLMVGTS